MMWQKQQAQYAASLLDPSMAVPDFVKKTKSQPSLKRFNVYRNNVMVSLTKAILEAYPIVTRLVGEEFATAMARVFVADNLPTSPVLLLYGEGYGDFIDDFEPAQSLPFLADIARLERAWLLAYHARDHDPLTIDALSHIHPDKLSDLTFSLCPGVQLLCSDHPMASIWLAHQSEHDLKELDTLPKTGESVLINRPCFEVNVQIIDPGFQAFLKTLSAQKSLGQAIDKGNGTARFDPAKAIRTLFELQTVCALKHK